MATGARWSNWRGIPFGEPYRECTRAEEQCELAGPCDCAEFISWPRLSGGTAFLYRLRRSCGKPATVDAYTGGWVENRERSARIPIIRLRARVGGILLDFHRRQRMGHIAICDGTGKPIVAKGIHSAWCRTRSRPSLGHRRPSTGHLLRGEWRRHRDPASNGLQRRTPFQNRDTVRRSSSAPRLGVDPGRSTASTGARRRQPSPPSRPARLSSMARSAADAGLASRLTDLRRALRPVPGSVRHYAASPSAYRFKAAPPRIPPPSACRSSARSPRTRRPGRRGSPSRPA